MINNKLNKFIAVIIITVILTGCESKKSRELISAADFLPEKIESAEIERSSEVRTFVGESLYEYINGGAEIYHKYKFIEVLTADYNTGDIEMTVDIFKFEDGDHSYGLYATHRPPEPDFINLGAEGFRTDVTVDFVKGQFYVKIIGFEEVEQTPVSVITLAREIEKLIPGDKFLPRPFALFPVGEILEANDKMFADSFLGQRFLTYFFVRKYQVDNDTLTLFITEKDAGGKFSRWFELASEEGMAEPGPEELPFDDGMVLVMDYVYYGKIIAGFKDGRLLGITNYDDDKSDFLIEWLESLP
ncbi:MAG: DUF6599 family protein [candidate division Zixibacteria bacterium]